MEISSRLVFEAHSSVTPFGRDALAPARQTHLCSFAIALGEIAHCVRNST